MKDIESFYKERDSRTIKLVGVSDYRNRRILLALDDTLASTVNGQIMALTFVNLVSRFCRRIDIQCPETPLCISLPSALRAPTLAETLVRMAKLIDPHGNFEVTVVDDDRYDMVTAIGQQSHSRRPHLAINSDGMSALVARGEDVRVSNPTTNPLGAACSSILASSEIFKSFVGLGNGFGKRLRFNLADCSIQEDHDIERTPKNTDKIPDKIDLGDVQMVGCGALGSGIGFFLSMLPVFGKVELIDYDRVEVSNLNRCLSFTTSDVGKFKTDALADFLANRELEVNPFSGKYSDYVDVHGAGLPDAVLSLVDRNGPRHEIQMNLPRLILYAATGEWVWTVGKHTALVDDCHICRFPDPDTDGGGECALAPIVNGLEEVDAAVPFVSGLASLILTAELVKTRSIGQTSLKNFLQLDMSLPFRTLQQRKRKRSEGCVCSETWFVRAYQKRLGQQPIMPKRDKTFSATDHS